MSSGDVNGATVDGWLLPLPDDAAPCGTDLEPDNEYLALTKALAGKPETQFSEAVPPDFRTAGTTAESLFTRTRDLRIAIAWARARLRMDGLVALPAGLRLMQGLLETFGAALHPMADPDDGSYYARINAVAELREPSGLLGDLRQAVLLTDRVLGPVRVRAVEIALGTITAREDEETLSREQLRQLFGSAGAETGLGELLARSLQALHSLSHVLTAQLDAQGAPDLKPLAAMLAGVQSLLPQEAAAHAPDGGNDPGATAERAGSVSGAVNSRADAVRAIDMVCEYLERTEPTNPAPLLLRRAKRLIDQNFLQLMKDLAPGSLADVARIMGVDPDSVVSPSDSG
ncbi:MAG: type VI secretion system ImpA family N-terminal domain-containing protein [Burkholderiales bacterium]